MTFDVAANRAVAERGLKALEDCLAHARLDADTRRSLERCAAYERARIQLLDSGDF